MRAPQTTASVSQSMSRLGRTTRYNSSEYGNNASLQVYGRLAARSGRALLGQSELRTGARHERDVCLTYRASQIGRSRSRTSRFIVSAEGEGTASGSQPSLDEINDSIDQPLEEEEPTFEDMLQKKIDEISSTKKTGETLIQAGMFAFERGAYPNAVQLFEESL